MISIPTEPCLPLIILGGGGHARVLVDTLLLQGREILGYTDLSKAGGKILGAMRLGDDSAVLKHGPGEVMLVNGVGSVGSPASRKKLFELYSSKGYHFHTVVHPSAVIAGDVTLQEGAQIMAGVVVQPGSRVGVNSILNTGALVDHDCVIGAHAHVAPGAVLSGNVRIGDEAHVGTGAALIQGVAVGSRSIVGAGTVVLGNVPPCVTFVGVPGRIIRRHAAE